MRCERAPSTSMTERPGIDRALAESPQACRSIQRRQLTSGIRFGRFRHPRRPRRGCIACIGDTHEPGPSGRGRHEGQRFRKLAESRTNKALNAISRVGNMSNRSMYEWEDEEARKILKALKNAVIEAETRFSAPKAKAPAKFQL